MDITIKKVEPGDTEDLRDFAITNFIATYAHLNTPENMKLYLEQNFTRDAFERETSHPHSYFFIAWKGREIVGYLKLNLGTAQTEPDLPGGCEIERIYVAASLKGNGLGRRLFEHAKAYGASKGARFLWLGVWENNEHALHFYRKIGMTPFGKHLFPLGNDLQTDIMMRIDLR